MLNLKNYGKRFVKIPLVILFLALPFVFSQTIAARNATTNEAQQQEIEISGQVVDNLGDPLIGVSISVQGTGIGTITDHNGNFNLKVNPKATLEVKYLGYVTKKVTVNDQKVIKITLSEDTQLLDEVVVVGYSTMKKASLTGAISNVGAAMIERSNATTTSGALVGKIAGVNTRMNDGRPGASTSLQIRNMGTPLYVIDGVQKDEQQFNNLDFNDIESISILKDASAAIYGVRAANGVVVISTKKGSKNSKNTATINAYYGWQDMFKYPKPADVSTYVKSYIQSDAILGQGKSDYNPKYTMEDLAKWQKGTEKGYKSFDWYDYILETGPQWYINANTSGGSEKINYYLSVGHIDQKANIVNYGGFDRTNIQFNLDANISKRLKLGVSMNGRIESRVRPGVPGGDDIWQALFATYRNLPTSRPYANDNPDYPRQTASDGGINFAMMHYDKMGKWQEKWRAMQLNFSAEYDLGQGFVASANGGYYLAHKWLDNQEFMYKLYKYNENTDQYEDDFKMENPWRERDIRMIEEFMSKVQLNYNNTFDVHHINALIATETYLRDTPGFWVHTRPTSNSLQLLDYPAMDVFNDTGVNTQARVGYISKFNYDYASKYLIEFSARYDGSWKFAPGHRWGLFPSASAGWRISEENFWKNSKLSNIFSDFKIRGSYGLLGNDDLGDDYKAYDYMSGYNYRIFPNNDPNRNDLVPNAVLDGNYVLSSQNRGLPNTSISWLKAKTLDIGIDVGLFGSQLIGSLDFFRRKLDGLPEGRNDVLVPVEAGFDRPKENLNSNVHTGMDGSLMWTSKAGDVNYFVGGNFTFARQIDWFRYNDKRSNSWDKYRNSINERYAYLWWGYQVDGQFQSWEEIANYPIDNDGKGNKTLRPGDLKYNDINGDGRIDDFDRRPVGYRADGATPYFNFGINLGAQWKGFDFAVDFTGATYASYFFDWEARNPFHDGGNNPEYYMKNQWWLSDITNPESAFIPGKYPTLLVGNRDHSNYWGNDFWLKNVNYVKLRNLELGYSIPQKALNKTGIEKVRVYTMMQNLFSIDNLGDIEIDPELSGSSGVRYPTNRVINIGINVTF